MYEKVKNQEGTEHAQVLLIKCRLSHALFTSGDAYVFKS